MILKDKNLFLVIAILLASIVSVGCSSRFSSQKENVASNLPSTGSSYAPVNGLVQSNEGGLVSIDVEWGKAENESLEFFVAMNTHSVDLDQYDLGKLAVLRDSAGKEYGPTTWDSSPGGHHRNGTLTFPLPDSVSQRKAQYVEVVIRDVAGIKERVLRWEL